ncbi:MAG TPA: metal ABC transporter substrate-binding protein [Planctomycetota bacterium]|nr:metal ABC transporter substrate-binding protein [Planctomycetota bacterium]
MKKLLLILAALLLVPVVPARAAAREKKKVMVTLAALKSITDALAGDDFEVTALAKPDQDPHMVTPTPTLMKKLREADLFIEIGLQLELWADQVATGSGNPNLATGARGRIVASAGISREEVPSVVSRSEGDIHPEGNPHIWIDPIRAKQIADNIAAGLKSASPEAASAVDERLKKFKERIDEALFGPELLKEVGTRTLTRKALDGSLPVWLEEKKLSAKLGGWLKKGQSLRGVKMIEYHKTWVYLAKLFGFEIVGSIQSKPGIEPGPKHIEELKTIIAAQKVKGVIVDNFYDPSVPNALSRDTGVKVAVVPGQPGGEAGTEDYISFIGYVIDRLVETTK